MKLSIFTTATDPVRRGDTYSEALKCYMELADEVIVLNGGTNITEHYGVKYVNRLWPKEFEWPFIGQQFSRGYNAASGDWVIHADLDFIFHEKDFKEIRRACGQNQNAPALSFWKYQFILPDRYNLKARCVLAVNKGVYGSRIKFNSGGDLCQPSLDGHLIKAGDVPEARVPFYNYEKMTKTADQIMDDCGRMDRAYSRHFKVWQLSANQSGSDESCFDGYIKLLSGRLQKPQQHLKFSDHPKYVQKTIKELRPNQFGYNGFGLFGGAGNAYRGELINA